MNAILAIENHFSLAKWPSGFLCQCDVTDGYTAGDNQLHDSTITSQLELTGTYYNENIFMRAIKNHEWASL